MKVMTPEETKPATGYRIDSLHPEGTRALFPEGSRRLQAVVGSYDILLRL